MEFKVLIYLIGGIVYLVYRQYQKLQVDAQKRKAQLEGEAPLPKPIVVETFKPLQRVKSERQQLDAENARLRTQNKMQVKKTPKPFFDKPEHVVSVFTDKNTSMQRAATSSLISESNENYLPEEIDIRKMILYSELLKRPAW